MKTFKFRLTPGVGKGALMAQHAGASRFVWNQLLDEAKGAFDAFCEYSPYIPDAKPPPVNYYAFSARFKMLRARTPWLQNLSSHICRHSAKRLAVAYKAAFGRVKKGGKLGLPRFHKKSEDESFTVPESDDFKIGARGIRLTKIGWVRMRPNRGRGDCKVEGKPKTVVVKREAGKWFACVQCEIDNFEPQVLAKENTAAGVDMGVAKTAAAVSLQNQPTIYQIAAPELECRIKRLESRRRRYQRAMSRKRDAALRRIGWDGKPSTRRVKEAELGKLRKARKEQGLKATLYGKRYDIARRRAAKASRQLANFRHNSLHHIAGDLTAKHRIIVVEDLQIKNMTRSGKGTEEKPGANVRAKAGLNRAILQNNWGMLRGIVEYKAQWRGGKVLKVPPHHTSQRCSQCGHVSEENRQTREKFSCQKCGHCENADINAAKNILALGLNAGDDCAHGIGAYAHGDCGVARSAKCETTHFEGASATGFADKTNGNAGGVG